MKKEIIILLSTSTRIKEMIAQGFIARFQQEITALREKVPLKIISSDKKDYTKLLNCKHFHLPFGKIGQARPIRHILYYLYTTLLHCFLRPRVIIISGAGYPCGFLLKFLSHAKIIMEFKYNWAQSAARDYKGIKTRISYHIQKIAFLGTDTIICTTPRLKNQVIHTYRKKEKDIHLLPNFVNKKIFFPSKKEKIIAYVGRIHQSKGIHILLEAFALLNKRFPEWKLILAGAGEALSKTQKLIKTQKLTNIEISGPLQHQKVAELLRKAYIFISSHLHSEGHPKALIEAMSCGCIPVVSDVPGNNDLIQEGTNGFLYKPFDARQLSEKIKAIIKKEIDYSNIQNKVIEDTKQYSFDKFIQKKTRIICKLL